MKLLTFNTWGLKYVSQRRRERLGAIAHRLEHGDWDVVALQEVWVEDDWVYLDSVCKLYPHRRYFKLGIVAGPGLAILSRVPISETFLYRFPVNGRPSAFFRGDWLVGKSAAVAVLKTLPPLAVVNTHMHAPYALSGDAAYEAHRACQAWDLAKLAHLLQRGGCCVVQVGDMNLRPGLVPYRLFTLTLADLWLEVGREADPTMSPHEQVGQGGVTCNLRLNSWRQHCAADAACRLDYAFVGDGLVVEDACVAFAEIDPALGCSLSDHFAYSVTLRFGDAKRAGSRDVYRDVVAVLDEYLKRTIPFQRNWRRAHAQLSILAVAALQFAIYYLGGLALVALCILCVAIALLGLVNGLIWSMGVRLEERAIMEVKMEVEDAIRDKQD